MFYQLRAQPCQLHCWNMTRFYDSIKSVPPLKCDLAYVGPQCQGRNQKHSGFYGIKNNEIVIKGFFMVYVFFHFPIKIVWCLKGLFCPPIYQGISFCTFFNLSQPNCTTRGLQGFKSLTKLNLNVNRYMCCFHHHNC